MLSFLYSSILTSIPSIQSYVFSSRQICMRELDYKVSWAPKNWCFLTVVLENTIKESLGLKEIKPVNPKGNQSWTFFEWSNAENDVPILWLLDAKDQLIGKDPDAGKIEGRRRWWKRMRWMVASLTQWTGVWAPGVGDGQGSLACCTPWGRKESDTIEWLDWIECYLGSPHLIKLLSILIKNNLNLYLCIRIL